MAYNLTSTVTLNDGVVMPRFGLGSYKAYIGEVENDPTIVALKHGYRLVDTAQSYQ